MIAKKIPHDPAGRTVAAQIGALVTYIFAGNEADPSDKLVAGGTMNMFADSPKAAIAEMIALGMACPKSKMPVTHWVLSWREGEQPSVDQVRSAVEMFANDIGFAGHQTVWGLHGNTDNLHVHIAVNRIHPERERVVKPHKGFDRLAAQRAATHIEHLQGWTPEHGAKYAIVDGAVRLKSELRSASAGANADDAKDFRPGYRADAVEIRQGVKSGQRIAHEKLSGILKNVGSWNDLHAMFAYAGAVYEPFGGGAVIRMNGVSIKASDLGASPKKLAKKLGPFRPCPPEFAGVTADTPPAPPMPVNDEAAEYQCARAAAKEARRQALATFDVHASERKDALQVQLRAERDNALHGSWRGRGDKKNALEAVLADKRARERSQLQAEIKRERAALRAQYPDFPDLPEWKKRRVEREQQTIEGEDQMRTAAIEKTVEPERLTAWSDLLAKQALERDGMLTTIAAMIRAGKGSPTGAIRAIGALAERHRRQIADAGEYERERIEREYEERRAKGLNSGGWVGRGAERNAAAKRLKADKDAARSNSLQTQAEAIRALRAVAERMRSELDPAPLRESGLPASPAAKPKRPSLSPEDVATIKRVSPETWLRNERSYTIPRHGPNKFSVRSGCEEVYRCERKANSDWTTFAKSGKRIGNNVQLVKYEAGVKDLLEVGAIFSVYPPGYVPPAGFKAPPPPRQEAPVVETPFRAPAAANFAERERGRKYLTQTRALPVEVVDAAEAAGFLAYSAQHVVFPGRDTVGEMRCAQIRRWEPAARIEKGAAEGSIMKWPAVWPGEDPNTVVFTESGISGLSVAALSGEAGEPVPTIISSGGSGSWRWVDEETSPARAAILAASRVIIAGENEDSADGQRKQDAKRHEMARRIAAATGRDPDILYPPSWAGDANNLWLEGKSDPVSTWLDRPPRWAAAQGSAPEM